jgi:hypothetical protein
MDRYEREQEIRNLVGTPQEDAPPGIEWWIGIDQDAVMEELDVPLGHMIRMSVPRNSKNTIRICYYGICIFAADMSTFTMNPMIAQLGKGLEQASRAKDAVTEWTHTERRAGLRPSASAMLGQLRTIFEV